MQIFRAPCVKKKKETLVLKWPLLKSIQGTYKYQLGFRFTCRFKSFPALDKFWLASGCMQSCGLRNLSEKSCQAAHMLTLRAVTARVLYSQARLCLSQPYDGVHPQEMQAAPACTGTHNKRDQGKSRTGKEGMEATRLQLGILPRLAQNQMYYKFLVDSPCARRS